MLESVLIVLSRPRAGLEAEYNSWYSHIHLHDALRFRCSVASQRFELSPRQPANYSDPLKCDYLALYEVTEAARFTQEHIDAMGSDRMHIALAFDHTLSNDFYYFPNHFIDNAPGLPPAGDVVMQQMHVLPGREAEFRQAYAEQFLTPALRRSGVRSGGLLEYRKEGQIFADIPRVNFAAIYRLSDPRAMDDWAGAKDVARLPLVDAETIQTSWWDVLTPRLTKDEVLNPTPELIAAEKKARALMGQNFIGYTKVTDIPALAVDTH